MSHADKASLRAGGGAWEEGRAYLQENHRERKTTFLLFKERVYLSG